MRPNSNYIIKFALWLLSLRKVRTAYLSSYQLNSITFILLQGMIKDWINAEGWYAFKNDPGY